MCIKDLNKGCLWSGVDRSPSTVSAGLNEFLQRTSFYSVQRLRILFIQHFTQLEIFKELSVVNKATIFNSNA